MPRQAASSKGLRGSIVVVRREAGDAPVDVRGVMPLTVAALAVSTCSRACAISPSARSSARSAASSADAALRRRTEASRRQLLELSEDLRPGAHHGVALLAGVLVVKTCVSIWEARE